MSDPILSFVIPVFRKPPEIFEKCLKSLFDQSLKGIEVICIFDGPNQELQDVAAKFKVISLVIEHGGAPKARNAGTEIASGKYVACWDADCEAKPDMAKRWIEEFEAVQDADFVYSGYEISGERGGFDSEFFDAYSLTCGNYIASMFPIKKEKAPKWDETLQAGQDWDFWLTAVEQGCKGSFIPGSGFIVHCLADGISSEHWAPAKREETIRTVREKHGIVDRKIGVYSLNHYSKAIKIARILGADVVKPTGPAPTDYKMIFNLGYGHLSRFEGFGDNVSKVQYWIPGEIEGLANARYPVVMETIRIAKGVLNLCNTEYEKNKLSDLGITAEVLPLPLVPEDLDKVSTALPDEFSVLVATDEAYGKLLKDLESDLPHVRFGWGAGKVKDFSCLISFYQFAALDEAILIAHVNGRNVISNVQAPYCGFIDPDQSWDLFKKELYETIRQLKTKTFNAEAQAYYLEQAKPGNFKKKVEDLVKTKMEVINV